MLLTPHEQEEPVPTEVMWTDAERLRDDRPIVLVSLREQPDAGPITDRVTALVRARRS